MSSQTSPGPRGTKGSDGEATRINRWIDNIIDLVSNASRLSIVSLTAPSTLRERYEEYSSALGARFFYVICLFLGVVLTLVMSPHTRGLVDAVVAGSPNPPSEEMVSFYRSYMDALLSSERVSVSNGLLGVGNLLWIIPSVILIHGFATGYGRIFKNHHESREWSYRAFFIYSGMWELLAGLIYMVLGVTAVLPLSDPAMAQAAGVVSLTYFLVPMILGVVLARSTMKANSGISGQLCGWSALAYFVLANAVVTVFHVLFIWIGTDTAAHFLTSGD